MAVLVDFAGVAALVAAESDEVEAEAVEFDPVLLAALLALVVLYCLWMVVSVTAAAAAAPVLRVLVVVGVVEADDVLR